MNFKKISKYIVYVFSIVGFIFTGVYFAMKWGLLNVQGSAKERNAYFTQGHFLPQEKRLYADMDILCQIDLVHTYAPVTSVNIYLALLSGTDINIIRKMVSVALESYVDNTNIDSCKKNNNVNKNLPKTAYIWADTEEWNLMKNVFTRDQDVIVKASKDAGISPRLLLGGVIGEQFRFFGNRRESFKQYFEPLKILASLSNTSFGIAGLKPNTARLIEENLKNKNSPFYLGKDMENLLDYDVNILDKDKARMDRITNTKDPYYSYLYVGLYMKQIIKQWENNGFDIGTRPDVLATLYNLGFPRSVPKENPVSGGAIINVGGKDYTFGDLGYEFYFSGELVEIFPFN